MLRLLAAFAALLLPAAPASAAAVRPHTRVATYARNGITVRRLQAAVTPAGARLRVAIRATVRDDGHLVRAVTVRAGACTGGSVAVPSCPDAVTFEVPVAAGRTS